MRWRLPKLFYKRAGGGRPSRVLPALALLLSLTGAACGYHVVGANGNLPKTWRTMAVPIFANHTLHYRLEQIFTQAVVRELEARTTYRIVPDPARADAVLIGSLTSIHAVPVLFDAKTGRATTMLVTVQAKVRLKDRISGKIIYRNDKLVFRDEYALSTAPQNFFDEEDPALRRMAGDFASRVVSDMLENF